MTTFRLEESDVLGFDRVFLNDQIHRIYDHIFPLFDRRIKSHTIFHLSFLFLGIVEVTLLFTFLGFLVKSSLFAFSLAFLFLTLFSYLVLRLYFQAKKREQFLEIQNRFLSRCKELVDYHEEIPEHHLALANACTTCAARLAGKESAYYCPPKRLDFLKPSLETFSRWRHWLDIHQMRELLLMTSVKEHIQLVKFEPTNLEVHAALANAYVMLSALYADADDQDDLPGGKSSDTIQQMMTRKFRLWAERAIEEFNILNDYAPDDPWVHAQLAYSYHDLGMPKEEMREYEIIRRLCPHDKEAVFKLGVLYFQQGENAKGLQIYEELKRSHFKKAEQLIDHYGDFANTISFGKCS